MTSNQYWGETSYEMRKIFYTWTIENYNILHDLQLDEGLTSPEFPNDESGVLFRLELIKFTYEGLFLLFHTLGSNPKLRGQFKIYFPKQSHFIIFDSLSSEPRKLLFSNFYKNRVAYMTDQNLILHCEIVLIRNKVQKYGPPDSLIKIPSCTFAEDFGEILNSKELTDVTIVTGDGHKIPAHKIILSARSKVFAAMFKHPMKENTENCIAISDFTFRVVEELIRYMYTGEAPKLNEMSEDLLAAADKYDLDRLKAMCAKSMCENLSIETAPMVLRAADLYNIKELKSRVIKFIQYNVHEVTETSNWKNLITDSNLILETLIEPKICTLKVNDDTEKPSKQESE